jgi:hypothetical protein
MNELNLSIMNKERYNQIVDDAYEHFITKTKGLNLYLAINGELIVIEGPVYNATPRLLTQDEFINKCKTNKDFSEKWGLKLCYCGNPVDMSNPDCVEFNLCEEHQMDA